MSTTDIEPTCCPTHKDTCRFGREHRWAGPFLLDGGKEVNGETWSHPDDVQCVTCGGVCDGNRPDPQPAPDTERDERLRDARRAVQDALSHPTLWRSAVSQNYKALDEEINRLDAVVTAVRDLHGEAYGFCGDCYVRYPCSTARALDGGAR